MWKDTRRSRTILNICLVILILIIIGGLVYVSLQLHAQTVEHDKELSEAYAQQQQQRTPVLDAAGRVFPVGVDRASLVHGSGAPGL